MSLESQDDSALSMKKRARRRLVGAIALVILMLIILPNILKNKSKVDSTPITVNMEAVEPVLAVDPNVQLVENAAGELLPVAEPETAKEVVPEDSAVEVMTEKSKAGTAKVTDLQIAKTEAEVKVPVVEKAPAEDIVAKLKADAEKVAQKVAANPVEEKVTSVKKSYVIQVGVFSKTENVKRLQAKIEGLGYASKTSKVKSGDAEAIRLRVGEFVTRDAADAALNKLNHEGLKDGIVIPVE